MYRTWYERTIENGAPEATLVVELAYETDPTAPDFDREGIDQVLEAIAARTPDEVPPAHVRIIPRTYSLRFVSQAHIRILLRCNKCSSAPAPMRA